MLTQVLTTPVQFRDRHKRNFIVTMKGFICGEPKAQLKSRLWLSWNV